MNTVLAGRRRDMIRLAVGLDALSPLKVLGRGYAIAKGPKGILKSKRDAVPGDRLTLHLSDGTLSCTVDP
jgi:exodeoxyribonuclease VII large subunit